VLTARFRVAKSDDGSTVPRKMDLYWFIPAFANKRVGSDRGTTDEEGTAALYQHRCHETTDMTSKPKVWPFSLKYPMNVSLTFSALHSGMTIDCLRESEEEA
jgi:hypothetical protein